MAIEKSYIDMLKERDAKIEALKELLRLSHESLDSKDKKIAELSLKACTLDLTKGHLTQCEAALESRDELNETLNAKIAELEKELEAAMTFNVDVVRCLSRIAVVENHNEVPAYIDMSRRCIKAIEAKQSKALEQETFHFNDQDFQPEALKEQVK
jgi:hypothetical protein